MTTHTGSCVCGAVRYQVELELGGQATRCNCTLCTKLAWAGAITRPEQFTLLEGQALVGGWARHPEIGTRSFCTRCGAHVFAKGTLPELGGAFVSVNVNTLDDVDPGQLTYAYFDGRHDNWQAGTRPTPWPISA